MNETVRPGYKQTEVGVIPVEWEVKHLSEIATIATGSTPPTADPANYGDDFLFVSPADLGEAKHIIKTEKRLSKRGFATVRRFPKDSVLFVCIGSTIGKCSIASVDLTSNQQINAIFPSPAFSADFLYYSVCSAAPRVRSLAGEQAVPLVNKSQFSETEIALPPLLEQRAIASVLSDMDALLDGLDRLIAKKRDLKQAAMQQLLTGKTRLPGFNGVWEVKRLGEICRIVTGKKDVNEGNPNGPFPFFTCSRSYTFSDSYSFDTEAILIAGNGEVGNLHYFNGKFEAYQRTYVLSEFSGHIQYVWQQLSAYLADSLGLGKIGSSIPYIKKENLVFFEFKSPCALPEQTAIAAVLSDMDAELSALEARCNKTRDLKQAMMQQLLTGRIRLVPVLKKQESPHL